MFLFRLLWLIPVIIFLLIVLKNKTLRTEIGYFLLSVAFFAIVGFVISEFLVVFISSALVFFGCIDTKYIVEMIGEFAICGALGGGITGLIIYPTISEDDMLDLQAKNEALRKKLKEDK